MNEGTVSDPLAADKQATTPAPPPSDTIAGELSNTDILEATRRVVGDVHSTVKTALKDGLGINVDGMSESDRQAFDQPFTQKALGSSLIRLGLEQEKTSEAKTEARVDDLTGLLNRKGFNEELELRIKDAETKPFGVLFLDLDDFKFINDTDGHDAGDDFLVSSARFIENHVRHKNGGPGDAIARMGGDEFAFIVDLTAHPLPDSEMQEQTPDITPEERLNKFADRLEKMFRQEVVDESSYKSRPAMGVSIGAAVYEPGMTGREVKTVADANMNERKRSHHAEHGAYRPVQP